MQKASPVSSISSKSRQNAPQTTSLAQVQQNGGRCCYPSNKDQFFAPLHACVQQPDYLLAKHITTAPKSLHVGKGVWRCTALHSTQTNVFARTHQMNANQRLVEPRLRSKTWTLKNTGNTMLHLLPLTRVIKCQTQIQLFNCSLHSGLTYKTAENALDQYTMAQTSTRHKAMLSDWLI